MVVIVSKSKMRLVTLFGLFFHQDDSWLISNPKWTEYISTDYSIDEKSSEALC